MPKIAETQPRKVQASLCVVRPKCGKTISPAEVRRIDLERIECPGCGERFVPHPQAELAYLKGSGTFGNLTSSAVEFRPKFPSLRSRVKNHSESVPVCQGYQDKETHETHAPSCNHSVLVVLRSFFFCRSHRSTN
jgi:hypothetical protein